MIELEPVFELGESIQIKEPICTFRLGKAEVAKSLRLRVKKVSKDHLQFKADYSARTVTVTAIGRNAAFHGEYEQPLVALKPGESTELSDGDIIGFRHDSYVYRLFIKPKIDLQTDQENNPEIFGAVDANWTSGSATPDGSDHEREIIVEPAHPVTGRIRPIPCEYGDRCFRRNPIHKQERCHPGDDDWWDPLVDPPVSDDPRAECEFGLLCYQKNKLHLRKFKHSSLNTTRRKRRAARRAEDQMRPESDGSNFSGTPSEHEWSDDDQIAKDQNSVAPTLKPPNEETIKLLNETKRILRDNNF